MENISLFLFSFILKWNPLMYKIPKDLVIPILEWIIDHGRSTYFPNNMVDKAVELKEKIKNSDKETIEGIVKTMDNIDGYDYGGFWSDHWYQCPNGHPYFIGHCVQAMEEYTCIECGEKVDGGNHRDDKVTQSPYFL